MTNLSLNNEESYIIKEGIKDSTPIWLSFFFMFASIGALSAQSNIGFVNSILMTVFIFAAPVQSVIIYTINKSHDINCLYIGITSLIINFRFLLNSATLLPYFKEYKVRNVLFAMLIFSASSFTVALVEFKSGKITKHYLAYFLAVAIPSYIVAILSTMIGYIFAAKLHNPIIEMIFMIVLPLHFAALTAKRLPNWRSVLITAAGFISMPFILMLQTNFIDLAFAVVIAILMVFFRKRTA